MNFILDIAVIAALALCVFLGIHRGAVRTLIFLAGCAAAFVTALLVSSAAAEYVYEEAVRPAVLSAIESKSNELAEEYLSAENLGKVLSENGITLPEEQLKNTEFLTEVLTKEEFRGTLNHIFVEYCRELTDSLPDSVPSEIKEEAERYIEKAETAGDDTALALIEKKETAAEFIECEIVKPVMLKTVHTVIFGLTFIVVMLAVSIAAEIVRIIRGIPVVRSADGFLGGVLGFFQGVLVIVVMCVAAEVFIKLTSDGNGYLNSDIISKTYIFKRLYSGTFLLLSLILNR